MSDVFSIIIIISLIIFFIYFGIKFYIRIFKYLSGFTLPVIDFLDGKELKLIEIKQPHSDDWKNNPFRQNDSYIIEYMLPFNTLKHKIIITSNKKNEIQVYWLQAYLKIFGKSEINFKKSELTTKQKKELKKEYLENFVIVKNICPACNEKIEITDIECKNCGLKIK